MSLKRVLQLALVVASASGLQGCGKDTSNAPTSCNGTLPFGGKQSSSGDAGFDSLSYGGPLPQECVVLVSQQSGGVQIRLDVVGEPVTGYIGAIRVDGGRMLQFANGDAEATLMNGVQAISRDFRSDAYGDQARRIWLLPWDLTAAPTKKAGDGSAETPVERGLSPAVDIRVAAGTAAEFYPRSVSLTIRALEP